MAKKTKKIWTLPMMVAAAMDASNGICTVTIGRKGYETRGKLTATHDWRHDHLHVDFSFASEHAGHSLTHTEASNMLNKQKALLPKLSKKERKQAKEKTAEAAALESKETENAAS